MGEADVDPRDGIVTADELVGYVQREVRNHVRAQGRQQNPQESGDFPDQMLLGFAAGRRSALAASIAEVSNGSVVVEANLEEVEVLIDGQRYGVAGPGKPLRVPGLASGGHKVEGIRLGYEPVTVEISVAPGTTQTVSLRLLHQRKVGPKAQALYDEGEVIWRRSRAGEGDLRRAEEKFGAALREDGQFGMAALGICRVQQALGKSGEALKICRRAVELEGDRSESRMMLAVLLMESGDYNEAVRQLQRAEAQDSKSTFVPSLLAEALFEADRPKEAEEAAERAIRLNEASAQGYLLRGEARRVQGKFDLAMGDYQRSLGLGEFGSGALRVVAYWAIGSGMKKHRSGRQVLQRSQKAAAYYGLCACQLAKESYREAVRECKRVLGLEKEDGETYILLAQVYAEWFSVDNRREYLEGVGESLGAVLRVNPNHAQAELFRKKVGEVRELLRAVR